MMKKKLLTLLLFLFLLRFAAGWCIAEKFPDFYCHNDGREYAVLAETFAKTGSMTHEAQHWYEPPRTHAIPEAFRTPMLPFCCGTLIFCGLPPEGAYALFQALCITIASLLLFRIMQRLVPEHPAAPWIALFLFTVHPLILEYSLQLCTETLFTLFILLFIGSFQKKNFILAGAAGAAMTLTRPTGLVFLPGIILLLLLLCLFSREYSWKHACLYGCTFFLLMLPYGIRNEVLFDRFSMTGFFGGFNFYVGNNLENMKAYAADSGPEFLILQNKGWANAIRLVTEQPPENSANPKRQDEYMRKHAFAEIRKMGAGNFLLLIFRKAKQFLSPWPVPGIHKPVLFWGFTLWELFLYAFAIAGIRIKRHGFLQFVPFAAVVLGGLSAHALVHVYMRHRIPFLDPVLIVFAALALAELCRKIRQKMTGKNRLCSPRGLADDSKTADITR